MVLTATRTPRGLVGMVEHEPAAFMGTHAGDDHPPSAGDGDVNERPGDQISTGRYPVLDVANAWQVSTMLTIAAPGIRHGYRREPDGRHTATMTHPDESWAPATAVGTERPTVHQGGPRRLWDLLDDVRDDWLRLGIIPAFGARVRINDDGSIRLDYGTWMATIPAAFPSPLPGN